MRKRITKPRTTDFSKIQYMNDAETAEYLAVSKSTARKISTEANAVIKVGKIRRVSRERLDDYMRTQLATQNACVL